jgi:hypothetical protein
MEFMSINERDGQERWAYRCSLSERLEHLCGAAMPAPFGRVKSPGLIRERLLFGLHTPPDNPRPSYRRLSRYDHTGLIWLRWLSHVNHMRPGEAGLVYPYPAE